MCLFQLCVKASILQCSAFSVVQFWHLYKTTGRTIALTICTFVGKVMSRFVIACILKISIYLFYFWLHWILVAMHGLPLAVLSRGSLPFVVVCGRFIAASSLAVQHRLQGVWDKQLWQRGLVALLNVGSSQTRDQTLVPYIGKWIVNHWTTREVLDRALS